MSHHPYFCLKSGWEIIFVTEMDIRPEQAAFPHYNL